MYSTEIPSKITAGNNIEFAFRAYDTSGNEVSVGGGYTGYLIINNSSVLYSASTSTSCDQGFLMVVPATGTSSYSAGSYNASVVVDNGTNRYSVMSRFVEVLPNLFSVSNHDSRSTARQILDAIDSAILGTASANQLAMSIAGRSIQRMGLDELIRAKKTFASMVANEEMKASPNSSSSSGNIQTRLM